MKWICLFISSVFAHLSYGGNTDTTGYDILRFQSDHTSFPDSLRMTEHLYDGKSYPREGHYDDNSVLVIVPKKIRLGSKIDMVFWFHGWFNSIDSSNAYFELAKQFVASNRNAILVIPETARNAPDSYGGKLENKDMFKLLVADIINQLQQKMLNKRKFYPGKITLSGHSGAYRLIAHILKNGGVPVQEVVLFDALYGQLDKYLDWIRESKKHRFVHWYTNKGGGTDEMTDTLKKHLDQEKILYYSLEETLPSTPLPSKGAVVFVHSTREHNDIIARPANFEGVLESRKLKIKKSKVKSQNR